eukprot:4241180-Pyramimonas_sp.AAC.1
MVPTALPHRARQHPVATPKRGGAHRNDPDHQPKRRPNRSPSLGRRAPAHGASTVAVETSVDVAAASPPGVEDIDDTVLREGYEPPG